LSQYDYIIKHRPGHRNTANALSRHPDYQLDDLDKPPALNFAATAAPQELLELYPEALAQDEYTRELITDRPLPNAWTQFDDGVLRYQDRIYVPTALRAHVLTKCHNSPLGGHLGIRRTIELVQRDYFWPGVATFARTWVEGCNHCARNKPDHHKAYGRLEPHPVPEGAWTRIGADFVISLPRTRRGKDAILVIIDAFTKMAHFIPVTMKGLTAKVFADLLVSEVVRLHGFPKTLISDRGSQMVNKTFKHICERFNLKHFPTTAYHPSGNGQTERMNQPLEAYLRAYINYAQEDWDLLCTHAEICYNNSKHEVTGMTPYFANLGRHPNFDIAAEVPGTELSDATATMFSNRIAELHGVLQEKLNTQRRTMGRYYNKRRLAIEEGLFQDGSLVWLRTTNIRTRRKSKKLDQKKIGPFAILEKVGTRAYRLDLPASLPIHDVFHTELLEPYRELVIPDQPTYPPGLVEVDVDIQVDAETDWEVQAIVDSRANPGGFKYKVRWKGNWADTWEPPRLLSCDELIDAFHAIFPDKPKPAAASLGR
jgi:transposase InsO family protein